MSSQIQPISPAHSRALECFVDQPDDLVGLIAYALYKKNIRDNAAKGNPVIPPADRNPGEGEIRAYRGLAVRSLEAFANKTIEIESPRLINFGRNKAETEALEKVLNTARDIQNGTVKASQNIIDQIGIANDALAEIRSSTRFWVAVISAVVGWILSLAITLVVVYSAEDWVYKVLHIERPIKPDRE